MSTYSNPKAPLAPDQKPPTQRNTPTTNPSNQVKDEEERELEEKRQARRNCCKKALKFMFSHIGLCGMVVAYSIAGGFIFQHLEKTNEKQECVKAQDTYEPMENLTKYNLWDISSHFRKDEDIEYALVEFQKMLVKFRDDVLALSYDGTNCSMMGEPGGPGYQWSFPGALLFSVTVITTIGKRSSHNDSSCICVHYKYTGGIRDMGLATLSNWANTAIDRVEGGGEQPVSGRRVQGIGAPLSPEWDPLKALLTRCTHAQPAIRINILLFSNPSFVATNRRHSSLGNSRLL
jgi:hypothetical protein